MANHGKFYTANGNSEQRIVLVYETTAGKQHVIAKGFTSNDAALAFYDGIKNAVLQNLIECVSGCDCAAGGGEGESGLCLHEACDVGVDERECLKCGKQWTKAAATGGGEGT